VEPIALKSSGGGGSRRRQRRSGALGSGRFAVARRPTGGDRRGEDHLRGGLKNEGSFAVERGADRERGAAVLLLGGADEFADTAHIIRCEGEADGLADGHGFRVGDDHAAPRQGLDQMPLSTGGEKPREEDEDDLEAAAHVWVVWLMEGNALRKPGLQCGVRSRQNP
jgi:hypothetical protein